MTNNSLEILLAVFVAAALVAWAWFWTGPELRWEHQLQTSGNSALARDQ